MNLNNEGGVMDIKRVATTAKMVIESLVVLLDGKGIDIESIKMDINGGNQKLDFKKLIDLAVSELKLIQDDGAQVPEWISVKDQLPPEGTEVLVHSFGQVQQATRDSYWSGGFKVRNCYGWQAAYSQSHWMPKSIKLPESFNFYYENDAKNKAMIEAQEQ